MKRLACINIDLDGLLHYVGIHALQPEAIPAAAQNLIDRVAINRFLELCDAKGVKGTLFAIGRDLGEAGAKSLRRAVESGHEVANHTYWHDYKLGQKGIADVSTDISRGADTIERACGVRPRGFRAPGYTFNATMYQTIVEQGYAYGSSVFPAAPYYLAKAAVLTLNDLKGKKSASQLDTPRVLTAPLAPYRPDPAEPYRRGAGLIPELPISVEPLTRFPFIGTFAATLPAMAVFSIYRKLSRVPFLNLELHGADLIDESDGTGDVLPTVQRDLRVPASDKIARLGELLRRIAQDYEVVTLLEAAPQVA